MSSDVIYARIPTTLKLAVQTYASEHGKTMAGAIAKLLDQALGDVCEGVAMKIESFVEYNDVNDMTFMVNPDHVVYVSFSREHKEHNDDVWCASIMMSNGECLKLRHRVFAVLRQSVIVGNEWWQ